MKLAVSEVFGPTFQGEGPHAGKRTAFLRLAGCNLYCSWCDTPYTWDWTGRNGLRFDVRAESQSLTVAEVLLLIRGKQCTRLVVTGGEPMLQQEALLELFSLLSRSHYVEVETNGTVKPSREVSVWVDQYNVSLKLQNSGVSELERFVLSSAYAYSVIGKAVFKFVVVTRDDLDEVDQLVQRLGLAPSTVWIMPEGRSADTVLARARVLAEPVLERGYNLTLRTQTLLWGTERGR